MAAKLALLIGPRYDDDLPSYCGPLEGVENDLELMTDMLCRNGFLLENIKVCCEEIFKPMFHVVRIKAIIHHFKTN